jgi:hypothetical protein
MTREKRREEAGPNGRSSLTAQRLRSRLGYPSNPVMPALI